MRLIDWECLQGVDERQCFVIARSPSGKRPKPLVRDSEAQASVRSGA